MLDAHVHGDPVRNPGVLEDLDVGGALDGLLVVPPNDDFGEDQWAIDLAATNGRVGVVVRESFLDSPAAIEELLASPLSYVGVRVFVDGLRASVVPTALAQASGDTRIVLHIQNPSGRWDAVARAAASTPHRHVAIDHLGHPPMDEGTGAAAWQDFLALARHPNVFVKFPNIAHFAGSLDDAERLVPFVDDVLEAFGQGRLVWASDWPRARATSYDQIVEAATTVLDACGAQHDAVFEESFRRLHAGSAAHA